MSQRTSEEIHFEGEEAGAGYASPGLDLIASAALVALSIAVMIGSLRLPVPGDITTAPGLLPFLTAASLAAMALGLALSALQRRRIGVVATGEPADWQTQLRTLGLAGVIAAYLTALQVLAFRHAVVIAGVRLEISAFEPVTIIVLATIIHLFWRGPLWVTALVSIGWTLFLSAVFQLVFVIPLPGS